MSDLIERFFRYVSFETTSDSARETIPSTPGQIVLLEHLAEELKTLGLEAVKLDKNGVLSARLPANNGKASPVMGLLAHVDTSSAASGKDVKPRIIQAYAGGDIVLNETLGTVLKTEDFPEVLDYIGQDLIVTDGTTLLGADDKGGVAVIVSAIAHLLAHPEIKHGEIKVAFTPDEEIGTGATHFDVKDFAADFAFTVDGGAVGELEYETFNAASAEVTVRGRSVHPGTAKNQMKNASIMAIEFNAMLPVDQRPEFTEGYEGFYFLTSINSHCEEAKLNYIIRDHDRAKFEAKKAEIQRIGEFLNGRYGAGSFDVQVKDSYYNMKEMILPHPEILEYAREAYRAAGIEPQEVPVRGGTDGSILSYMGLPTPNIFTGGHNYHGRFEYIPVQSLEKSLEVVIHLAEIVGRAG